MKLLLDITAEEIKEMQNAYASACANPDKRCRPRLTERHWIAREIAQRLPSGATSQKGQWAVDATLAPFVEEALLKVPRYKLEAASEEREASERRRVQEERNAEQDHERQIAIEHVRDCKQCTVSLNETVYPGTIGRTMEFSGPNFSGQLCKLGYNLIQPLIDSGVIYWRGHRPKAPTATVPQQKS